MEEQDKGRMRICEFIATEFPYSADEVYFVYEHLRKKNEKNGKPVSLNKQIRNTKSVLDIASTFQIPLKSIVVAIVCYEETEK